MTRQQAFSAFALAILAATCVGCGEDGSPHGRAAVEQACDGVVDSAAIREAERNDRFEQLFVKGPASGDSHSKAAQELISTEQAAYACELSIDDTTGWDKGLSIKFIPGPERLFPERENRSFDSYKAYKLGSGIQATSESGLAAVFFPCQRRDDEQPNYITGTFFNDLDLTVQTQFRVLFRSSAKMIKLLKCENEIQFPAPDAMKALPR
ncbi:hypothetical protein [Streptomyces djakartensis]|uniref:hypothetical protein n=1 Tax=Streptomyces djakartensis TaxID=68193 RepID=UPI0034DF2732